MKIANLELIACLVGLQCFMSRAENRIIRLNCDNQNVVTWLRKGRARGKLAIGLLAAWELMKYKAGSKISVQWIPSEHNGTADCLSRGKIPQWIRKRGKYSSGNIRALRAVVARPARAWELTLR